LDISVDDIVSVGISNQRETIVVWDVTTSQPLHNAIVWMDTRSSDIVEDLSKCGLKTLETIQSICGLPLSTYFSAPKLCWLLQNNSNIKSSIEKGTCRIGTIDTWLIWVFQLILI
jgi:glycerol kinase